MAAKPKRRIDFGKLTWRKKVQGAPERRYTRNGKAIRLIRYTDEFNDKNWSDKGRIGMVLSGRIVIEFNNERVEYKAGDALFISAGERDKHKAKVEPGEEATLLLFEET